MLMIFNVFLFLLISPCALPNPTLATFCLDFLAVPLVFYSKASSSTEKPSICLCFAPWFSMIMPQAREAVGFELKIMISVFRPTFF